jgi:hypothetical protein
MSQVSGYVYVIGNAGVGIVKIGYAARVDRRLAELSTGYCPRGVEAKRLQALRRYESPVARSLEFGLHQCFAKARLPREGMTFARGRGGEGWTEWFDLGRNALNLVDWQAERWLTERERRFASNHTV